MDLLTFFKYLVVFTFFIFSFAPFKISKNLFIGLDILSIIVLISLFLKLKGKNRIAPIIATIFLISAHFLDNVKCGMCVGLGIGVILSYLI